MISRSVPQTPTSRLRTSTPRSPGESSTSSTRAECGARGLTVRARTVPTPSQKSHLPAVLVVMGVSGAGKTTIGTALAAALGWPFLEGDEYHPAANVARMKAGIALTDADRA